MDQPGPASDSRPLASSVSARAGGLAGLPKLALPFRDDRLAFGVKGGAMRVTKKEEFGSADGAGASSTACTAVMGKLRGVSVRPRKARPPARVPLF
jgi:hypothetical protein